jgi:hypothetical protein
MTGRDQTAATGPATVTLRGADVGGVPVPGPVIALIGVTRLDACAVPILEAPPHQQAA